MRSNLFYSFFKSVFSQIKPIAPTDLHTRTHVTDAVCKVHAASSSYHVTASEEVKTFHARIPRSAHPYKAAAAVEQTDTEEECNL